MTRTIQVQELPSYLPFFTDNLLPAVPNTQALIYDCDRDADGVLAVAVIAWRIDYTYSKVAGAKTVVLSPVGFDGPIDTSRPYAIKIGKRILANEQSFPSVDEWLDSCFSKFN